MVTLQLSQIHLVSGQRLVLQNVNWQQFEQILDDSFYIANHQQMIGRTRIDLTVDPPPDLAIEIDLTSKTQLDAYAALGVPELWRFQNRKLRIDVLQAGRYVESSLSPTLPNLPIIEAITEAVNQAGLMGRSPALRAFRQWARQQAQK
jgi:Uma2 family endonuclease